MNRFFRFALLILILLGGTPASEMSASAASASPGLHLVHSDEHGAVLSLESPEYQVKLVWHDGRRYSELSVPGASQTMASGFPQLPVFTALLAVPGDAEVSVRIVDDRSQPLDEALLLPPSPYPSNSDDEAASGTLVYRPDAQAYAAARLYPAEPVRLADDAWVRDLRVVRLEVYPFQYVPSSGKLFFHRHLTVEVQFHTSFDAGGEGFSPRRVSRDDPFEMIFGATVWNYETARAWRGWATPKAQVTPSWPQDATTRYKISLDQDGLYRLTYNDLAAFPQLLASDPRNWRLSNLGDPVAIYITGQADGHFDLDDEVIFYGQQFRGERFVAKYADEGDIYWLLDNCTSSVYCPPEYVNFQRDAALNVEQYTRENVYWLDVGASPASRMLTVDATPGSAPLAESYTATVHAEESHLWSVYPIVGPETWYWDKPLSSGASKTFTTTLTSLASLPFTATIRAAVDAKTNDSVTPDHHAQFSLNSSLVHDALWDGISHYRFEAPLAQSLLNEGVNSLTLSVIPVGTVSQKIYFDWFEISYARRFVAENGQLTFTGSAATPQKFAVTDLTDAKPWVLKITDPLSPTILQNVSISGSNPYTATFEVASSNGQTYFVVSESAIRSPNRVQASTPPDLLASSNGADYVFVTHADFITPTQQLAAYRASQGLRTQVVLLDDLFDLFTDGIYNPVAIKHFLNYAYHHWQEPKLSYALLVGGGHSNFKGYAAISPDAYRQPDTIFMPPYMVLVDPWQGEGDSLNLLAAVEGDDILPDLSIGRAVVTTPAEMKSIVDKIVAYEAAPIQEWQRHLLFIADNTPDPLGAGDFVDQSNQMITHTLSLSSDMSARYRMDRLYWNDYYPDTPAMTFALTDTLSTTGALFVNYIGHGAIASWTSELIFTRDHVSSLQNGDRLPIFLEMTCLTGYWLHPLVRTGIDTISLDAELVRAENKGAIAVIASAGRGVGTGHDIYNRAFYEAVFRDEASTLGLADLGGKLGLFTNGVGHYDLINTFEVFGDPALGLPLLHYAYLPQVIR